VSRANSCAAASGCQSAGNRQPRGRGTAFATPARIPPLLHFTEERGLPEEEKRSFPTSTLLTSLSASVVVDATCKTRVAFVDFVGFSAATCKTRVARVARYFLQRNRLPSATCAFSSSSTLMMSSSDAPARRNVSTVIAIATSLKVAAALVRRAGPPGGTGP